MTSDEAMQEAWEENRMWLGQDDTLFKSGWNAALEWAKSGQEPVGEVIWKDIEGFEEIYEVSEKGQVRNKKTNRILKQNLAGRGYPFVALWKDGKATQKTIHRILAETFLTRFEGQDEVNHIDGDKENNSLENLEWCTRSENIRHARHILNKNQGGLPPRRVCSKDLITGEIQEFQSIEEAVRNGFSSAHIYKCLNGSKKSHKGREWQRPDQSETHPAPAQPVRLSEDEVFGIWDNLPCSLGKHITTYLANAIQDAMLAKGAAQPAKFNGWYCAQCQCGVDPSEVTYHETHTVCGRYITDDTPTAQPAVVQQDKIDAERYRFLRDYPFDLDADFVEKVEVGGSSLDEAIDVAMKSARGR